MHGPFAGSTVSLCKPPGCFLHMRRGARCVPVHTALVVRVCANDTTIFIPSHVVGYWSCASKGQAGVCGATGSDTASEITLFLESHGVVVVRRSLMAGMQLLLTKNIVSPCLLACRVSVDGLVTVSRVPVLIALCSEAPSVALVALASCSDVNVIVSDPHGFRVSPIVAAIRSPIDAGRLVLVDALITAGASLLGFDLVAECIERDIVTCSSSSDVAESLMRAGYSLTPRDKHDMIASHYLSVSVAVRRWEAGVAALQAMRTEGEAANVTLDELNCICVAPRDSWTVQRERLRVHVGAVLAQKVAQSLA